MELTTTYNQIKFEECKKESQKSVVSADTFFVVARCYDFNYEKAHKAITLWYRSLSHLDIYAYYSQLYQQVQSKKHIISDRELGESEKQYADRKRKESWAKRIKSIMSI